MISAEQGVILPAGHTDPLASTVLNYLFLAYDLKQNHVQNPGDLKSRKPSTHHKHSPAFFLRAL
jgi:hypothetical protein